MGFSPNELKAARIRRGVTQKYMAERLGCTGPSYCMKENGVRNIFIKDANSIADILKLSPQEIITIFFRSELNFNLIRQKSSTSKVGDEGGYGEFT